MRPEEQNLAYLWDMREAAKEIVAFVKGIKYDKFIQNRMIRYAVERQLLVIGEAANHVSPEFQEIHPEISWRKMIALRNMVKSRWIEFTPRRRSVCQNCSRYWNIFCRKNRYDLRYMWQDWSRNPIRNS
jgi:uncharacterized protein with HEPN domain